MIVEQVTRKVLSTFAESGGNKINDAYFHTLCRFTLLYTICTFYKLQVDFRKPRNLLSRIAGQNDFPLVVTRLSNTTDFLTQIRTCRAFNRRRDYKDSTLATVDSRRPRTITVPSLTPTHYEMLPRVSRRKTAERGSSFEFHGWPPDDDWCTRWLLPTLEASSLCSLSLSFFLLAGQCNSESAGIGTSVASIFFFTSFECLYYAFAECSERKA